MKSLIVDDQYEGKASRIVKILNDIGVQDVSMVASARQAVQILQTDKVDLLILDLQIPTMLGDETDIDGGQIF